MKSTILFFALIANISLFGQNLQFDSIDRNLIPIKSHAKITTKKTSSPKFSKRSVDLLKEINCFESKFWTPAFFDIDTKVIKEFDLDNLQVSQDVVKNTRGSLLISYLPFDQQEKQTFFSSSADSIFYLLDSTWAFSGFNGNDWFQSGGFRYHQYFMGEHLWYSNGSTPPTIIYPNINYCVADVAVDSLGRAWVFTGLDWPISDTLRVIMPSGIEEAIASAKWF